MNLRKVLAPLIAVLVILSAWDQGQAMAGDEKEKGTPEAPSNAKAVAGSYYRGDGLGYNVSLTLKENGKYTAEWHGCLGKYGEASGNWSLTKKRITFLPSKEEGNLKGYLKKLDVLKFKGDWILLPTDKEDRGFYDKWGVSRSSCFQKVEKIK
jgi:hypothetical protein